MFLPNHKQSLHQLNVNSFLQEAKQSQKKYVKPIISRQKYYQVYEWSKRELSRFQKSMLESDQIQISIDFLQEQKKIILSMLLQLSRLCKQQCQEKGFLIQEMLNFAISFMNQHQKYYDILSYKQIKNFQVSTSELEQQYKDQIQSLKKQLSALKNEKDKKWKNMYMVVKDNRILRHQKAKLLTLHRQQAWKIKLLEEDLISLRSQNQKYKLMLESYNTNQNYFKTYISNHILLNKLDQKIKKYPGKARSLLKKQLFDIEINEINCLDEKIKFIIQSIEQNNSLCDELDDWADHVESTRLFYNVSVQTYIQIESVGINTITPVVIPKVLQSIKCQAKPRELLKCEIIRKIYDMKLLQIPKKSIFVDKKRTDSMSMTSTFSKIKKRLSIASNSEQPIQETKHQLKSNLIIVSSVVNIKLCESKKKNKVNKQQNSIIQQNDEEIKNNQNDLHAIQSSKNLENNASKTKVVRKTLYKKQGKLMMQKNQYDEEIFMESEINKQSTKKSLKKIKKTANGNTFNGNIFVLYYEPKQKLCQLQQNINFKKISSIKVIKQHIDSQKNFTIKDQILVDKKTIERQSKPKNQNKYNEEAIHEVAEISQSESNHSQKSKAQNRESQSKVINERILKQTTDNNKYNPKLKISKQKIAIEHLKQKINKPHKNESNSERINGIESNHQNERQRNAISTTKKHRRQFTQVNEYQPKLQNLKSHLNKKRRSLFSDDIQNMLPSIIDKIQWKQKLKEKQKINSRYKEVQAQNQYVSMVEVKPKIKHGFQAGNKKITIFPQSLFMNPERLLQKLLSSVFSKRKQIIKNPQNLKNFLHTFLLVLVGQKNTMNLLKGKPSIKFFSSIKEYMTSKADSLYVCVLFQKLTALQSCEIFNQDIFVLFAIMLDKLYSFGAIINMSNVYAVSLECAIKVMEYLCSIYLSVQQTQMYLKSIFEGCSASIGINMIQKFISLVIKLESIVYDSQLWSLLSNCTTSWSNEHLSATQILQFIWPIFLNYSATQIHLKRISHYSSTYFPLHRLCLYAHRYNWNEVYKIKTWINHRYLQYFQQFPQFDNSPIHLCAKIQKQLIQVNQMNKIEFIIQNFKIMCFKFKTFKVPIDWNFLKMCRICILMNKFEQSNIFPVNLNLLSVAYRKQIVKISN